MSLYSARHVCDGCGKLHIGGWKADNTCTCPDNPYTAPDPILTRMAADFRSVFGDIANDVADAGRDLVADVRSLKGGGA